MQKLIKLVTCKNNGETVFLNLCISMFSRQMHSGFPFCRRATPRPVSLASHCSVTSSFRSYYLSTGCCVTNCLIVPTAASCCGSNVHSMSLSISRLSDSHTSDRWGMNFEDSSQTKAEEHTQIQVLLCRCWNYR